MDTKLLFISPFTKIIETRFPSTDLSTELWFPLHGCFRACYHSRLLKRHFKDWSAFSMSFKLSKIFSLIFSLEEKLMQNLPQVVSYFLEHFWITYEFSKNSTIGLYFWFIALAKPTHVWFENRYSFTKKQALLHAKSIREGFKMRLLVKLKWMFDSIIISDFLVWVRR